MTPLTYLIILALVQGLTEFLPISSSAHLSLLPYILHQPPQDLSVDVALHLGTLFAVILWMFKDMVAFLKSLGAFFQKNTPLPFHGFLLMTVIVASLPVIIAGYFVAPFWNIMANRPGLIGFASILFGMILYAVDKKATSGRSLQNITVGRAFWIGLGQILALVPGVSRSGITITVGRALGFSREASARFSVLLSVPAILGAATLSLIEVIKMKTPTDLTIFIQAFGLSFLAGFAGLAILFFFARHFHYTAFVIYRLFLGIVLFAFAAWQ